MSLTIQNQTAGTLSYLGGAVSVSGNSNLTVPPQYIFPIAKDAGLINDCLQGNVNLSDGFQVYTIVGAATLLSSIASSIGGAVVGLIGQTAPSYAILVGSVDASGNTRPANIDADGGILIAGGGTPGTATGGVLSVQGQSAMTPILVSGNVASGAADSGNPLKISGVYNSNLPTPSSGQRNDVQLNQFAEVSVQYRNKFRNLTGNATTTVKSGSGRLHGILVNRNWTGGTIVLYDNTAGSGTVIATIDVGTPAGGLLSTTGLPGPVALSPLGLEFSTGLTAVTSGSTSNNFTILYQ